MKQGKFPSIGFIVVLFAVAVVVTAAFLPVFSRSRVCGPIGRTQLLITSMATALKAYYSEYGAWPNFEEGKQDHLLSVSENEKLLRLFQGENINNSRNIKFLEVRPQDLGLVDVSYNKVRSDGVTNLVNVSGNSIRVAIDYDGDGQVVPGPGISAINGPIAVWTVRGSITNTSW